VPGTHQDIQRIAKSTRPLMPGLCQGEKMYRKILGNILIIICFASTVFALDSHEYMKPEDVVICIYRDFSWEAVMDTTGGALNLIEQPKDILALYFSDEITSLIMKDRECVESSGEICNLNFDPIFCSQDPGAYELKISPVDSSGIVRVQFLYPSNDELIKVSYKIIKTVYGWRIGDVFYSNGSSLLDILKQK
jgi:hypothetical protein